jgi:hypothetical protein
MFRQLLAGRYKLTILVSVIKKYAKIKKQALGSR